MYLNQMKSEPTVCVFLKDVQERRSTRYLGYHLRRIRKHCLKFNITITVAISNFSTLFGKGKKRGFFLPLNNVSNTQKLFLGQLSGIFALEQLILNPLYTVFFVLYFCQDLTTYALFHFHHCLLKRFYRAITHDHTLPIKQLQGFPFPLTYVLIQVLQTNLWIMTLRVS